MSEKILPSSPVFYDPRGRRWRHVKRTYLALGVIITTLAAIFIASVLSNPLLPRFNPRPLPSLPHAKDLKPIAPPPTNTPLPASFSSKSLAIGFYINWDESSLSSLQRNLDHLDWVVPQ